MARTTRICIDDDHPIVRAGVRLLADSRPEVKLVGEASTREEVLRQVAEQKPDVLVLDLWLGEDDGLEILHELRLSHEDVRVLVYSNERRSPLRPARHGGRRGGLSHEGS